MKILTLKIFVNEHLHERLHKLKKEKGFKNMSQTIRFLMNYSMFVSNIENSDKKICITLYDIETIKDFKYLMNKNCTNSQTQLEMMLRAYEKECIQ